MGTTAEAPEGAATNGHTENAQVILPDGRTIELPILKVRQDGDREGSSRARAARQCVPRAALRIELAAKGVLCEARRAAAMRHRENLSPPCSLRGGGDGAGSKLGLIVAPAVAYRCGRNDWIPAAPAQSAGRGRCAATAHLVSTAARPKMRPCPCFFWTSIWLTICLSQFSSLFAICIEIATNDTQQQDAVGATFIDIRRLQPTCARLATHCLFGGERGGQGQVKIRAPGHIARCGRQRCDCRPSLGRAVLVLLLVPNACIRFQSVDSQRPLPPSQRQQQQHRHLHVRPRLLEHR